MGAGEVSDMAQVGAAVVRLERRVEELAAAIERQDEKLDRVLALTTPEEAEQGPELHELMAELARITAANNELLQRVGRQLERGSP